MIVMRSDELREISPQELKERATQILALLSETEAQMKEDHCFNLPFVATEHHKLRVSTMDIDGEQRHERSLSYGSIPTVLEFCEKESCRHDGSLASFASLTQLAANALSGTVRKE